MNAGDAALCETLAGIDGGVRSDERIGKLP